MTLGSWLREQNLFSHRPLWYLPLTPVQRRIRLKWCLARSTRNCADWGRMVFSDQSHSQLCPDDNCRRLLRCPGQWEWEPYQTIALHTGPQKDVMVWDAISFNSRTYLLVISRTLTVQTYANDILQPVVSPVLLRCPGLTFQHDNARLHVERVAMNCLKISPTLIWPARSSDVSPLQ